MSVQGVLDVTKGRAAATTATAMIPTGMFTSNTHLQLKWSVMNPPAVAPTTEARPNTAPNRPCARALWAGGERGPMTGDPGAPSTPPKMPWVPRATLSWVVSWGSPQNADAPTTPISPASRTGFLPNRSPSLPAIGVIVVDVTR